MRLYESLYIFMRYSQDIKFLMELLIDFGYHQRKQNEWGLKDKAHYVVLYNTILMNVCSYLDEYNKNFSTECEPEYKSRILEAKKIAKPAYKEISKWKDLKDYRNNMIAHNFRIDGKDFSFNMLGQYNAPRTYRDIVLLRKHLIMINSIIQAEFEFEMTKINSYIDSFEVIEQKINYDNIENDLVNLLNQINLLCAAHNKNYRLKTDQFMNL
jgi:hypothetical protein